MSEKDLILNSFWLIFTTYGKTDATLYLNDQLGLSVPTFVKFKQPYKKNDGYICTSIDLVKPYHINGLIAGWPAGKDNPEVVDIWCHVIEEAERAMNEILYIDFFKDSIPYTIEFVPTRTGGYIFLDYT